MKRTEKQEKENLSLFLARVKARQALIEQLSNPQLTLEESALLLGVSKNALRKYTNQGRLKCIWTPGGQRRFYLSDLLEFYGRMDGEYLSLINKLERLIASHRPKKPRTQKKPGSGLFDEPPK